MVVILSNATAYLRYLPPGPQLPSQLHSVNTLWPVAAWGDGAVAYPTIDTEKNKQTINN